MKIKAAVCRDFEQPLVIEEIDLAEPGAGSVRVKLAACAICHSDILYMKGAWGGVLPAVYGHEASGVVEEVGPGVSSVGVGDHVVVTLIRSCGTCHHCAQGDQVICETRFPLDEQTPLTGADGAPITHGLRTGAFAERVVVDASQVVSIPKDVPLDSASLLACGVITGLGAVKNAAQVPVGSNVAVIGTGGVGLNSVQGAALSGARTVIAVDLSDDKLEAARSFGATHAVNSGKEDAADYIRGVTDGRGADYAFVTVGVKTAFESAFHYIARGGSVVIVGMPPSGTMVEFDPDMLAGSNRRVIGTKMGSTNIAVDIPALVDLYKQGRLKLDELITGRYKLEEINEAVDSVLRGEALRNVIIF